jgi:hypothetical protein
MHRTVRLVKNKWKNSWVGIKAKRKARAQKKRKIEVVQEGYLWIGME